MANKKISQLSATTEANDNVFLVMNNSGNTETFRIKRSDLLSGTSTPSVFDEGDGTDSIKASYLAGTDASNTRAFAVGNGATATGINSSVIGGDNNTATKLNASVIGGNGNTASGNRSTVIGGENNTAGSLDWSTVIGSNSSTASGYWSFIGASRISTASSDAAALLGTRDTNVSGNEFFFGGALVNFSATGNNKRGNASIGNTFCQLQYGEQSGIYSTHESDILGTNGNEVKRSFIMGGTGNTINNNVNKSGIIGGNDNVISASAENVVIIGGNGITGTTNNTTYVDNIHTLKTETFDVIAGGNVGGTINVDCSLGTIFTFTMTADTTPNFINLKTGQRFIFIIDNTTFNVPDAQINGVSGNVYAKNGTIAPSNNAVSKYTATFDGTRLFLDEELAFSAV